jgi:hypothetical protein
MYTHIRHLCTYETVKECRVNLLKMALFFRHVLIYIHIHNCVFVENCLLDKWSTNASSLVFTIAVKRLVVQENFC